MANNNAYLKEVIRLKEDRIETLKDQLGAALSKLRTATEALEYCSNRTLLSSYDSVAKEALKKIGGTNGQ